MKPTFKDNILYVGGSGEGNYTTIQDAIDNASDGDTVFVFDDNSPYNEFVLIRGKSIYLIGEKKDTTIIENGIYFFDTRNVKISGFTTKAIEFEEIENATISNNKILGNGEYYSGVILSSRNEGVFIISNNVIYDCGWRGIYDYQNSAIYEIINNTILNNKEIGLDLSGSGHLIIGNTFLNNSCGLSLSISRNCKISGNTFKNNQKGIIIQLAIRNIINNNNFLNNKENVQINNTIRNKWNGNYWDDWKGIGPYLIFGRIFWIFPYGEIFFIFPWVQIDWCPAKEPYDIEVSV